MRRRYYGKKYVKREKTKEEVDDIVSKLHPFASGVLASFVSKIDKDSGLKSSFDEWIYKSAEAVLNKKETLSEKWVSSINKWVEKQIKTMSAEDPEYEIGKRYDVENLKIIKVGQKVSTKRSFYSSQYTYCIAISDNGWKYYFIPPKKMEVKEGLLVKFSGIVKSNKDGITFFSKIKETTTNN